MPSSGQEVRYERGSPTIFSDLPSGSIQVTPVGYNEDDDRLVFGVAAFNKVGAPVNFGTENIRVTDAAGPLKVYSRDGLAHEAKVRARWQAFATVLAGAAAAYAAQANAYHTTQGYVSTPYGGASFYARSYDPYAAYAGSAAAGAATAYGLSSIKNSLDETLAGLNGDILQTTTVDPGNAAGGVVVVDMPKGRQFPQSISAEIAFANETHAFQFVVTKGDQPRPVIPESNLTTSEARQQPSGPPDGWSESPPPVESQQAPLPPGVRPAISIPYTPPN